MRLIFFCWIFKKPFFWKQVLLERPLIPLFWTSADIWPEFQRQGESLAFFIACLQWIPQIQIIGEILAISLREGSSNKKRVIYSPKGHECYGIQNWLFWKGFWIGRTFGVAIFVNGILDLFNSSMNSTTEMHLMYLKRKTSDMFDGTFE